MKKATPLKPQSPFGSVTVTTGPLAGMIFTIEDHTPVEKGKVKVKYKAPDEGPRAVVEHVQVRGQFDEPRKAEDVRIAFAKLLPANILWDAETGYSDRISAVALYWDPQLARFIVQQTASEQEQEITVEQEQEQGASDA